MVVFYGRAGWLNRGDTILRVASNRNINIPNFSVGHGSEIHGTFSSSPA